MRHVILVLIAATLASPAATADRFEVQTDWSGGDRVPGPVATWSNTFESADGVAWRTFPGRLVLSASPIPEPVDHLMSDDLDGAIKVYAADVDLDGDVDILGCSYWDDRVELFLNDGHRPPGWVRQSIAEDFERALAVSVADIDGDGLPDVIAGSDVGGEVAWWHNSGGTPITWTRHDVDTDVPGAHDVHGSDLDGDGDQDIVGVSYEDDLVLWWRNDGGDPTQWTRLEIASGFDYPTKVDVGDMDGDGYLDVVAVAWLGERLAWWRSDGGSPPNWTEQTITTGFTGAHWVRLADMDADGRLDAVGAAMDRREVAWWRNSGDDPIQWQKNPLPGPLSGAVSVCPADLDGDGDMDIAASGWSTSGGVVWWENRDGSATDWLIRIVDRPFGESSSVDVADVDGDGAADLLASSWNRDSLGWWRISEPVDGGTISSSILDCGGPMEWTHCHWNTELSDGAEIRVEGRASDDPSSMGAWITLEPGPLAGILQDGARYFQYRIRLTRGASAVSPVVHDIEISGLEWGLPAPRRPSSRRVAP